MRPFEKLRSTLDAISTTTECPLFTVSDLRSVLPGLSSGAFKTLLSRTAKKTVLKRVCRGLYSYPTRCQPTGLELYYIAARLRAHEFNYISLESALSDAGVISQIPMQWITLMSSGRTQTIECADFGHIEFIHTKKKPAELIDRLSYDKTYHLWRASVPLAIEDMKATQRSLELIDWSVANEFI